MQIKTILIVAMLCLAMSGIAIAPGTGQEPAEECCWAEPCGTLVEECDQETTFVLSEPDGNDVNIIVNGGQWFYVDMNNDGIVSYGDVRLTGYHENYTYNTKVLSGDDDNLLGATVLSNQTIITYWDINDNGMYDLYDPAYVDVDDDAVVSVGDIRLTDVPPVDVYSLEDSDLGQLVMEAGDVNDVNNQRWSVVTSANDAGQQDKGMTLAHIGTGDIFDLLGYIDVDASGTWTCPDKLYIEQPRGCWFDPTVTIGDIRLYIPAYDEHSPSYNPAECVPACGSKVVQGDADATYVLTLNLDVDLAYDSDYPENQIYVDMDNNGFVSFGDIRLSNISTTYPPNTKVGPSNQADLNNGLTDLSSQNVSFSDIDGLPGYSIGDPLYLDIDQDDLVSAGDLRLNDVPVFAQDGYTAGEIGMAYTFVESGALSGDLDVGNTLEVLDEFDDLVGYIDSDCTDTWTCPDKLYLQQLFDERENGLDNVAVSFSPEHYDNFVTVGDDRLYVPVNDPFSPFYDEEEDWPVCGTKVVFCDIDATFVVKNIYVDVGFIDRNKDGLFDQDEAVPANADAAYLDMDRNGNVSIGDIRLNNFTISGELYEGNTKVAEHDADLRFQKPLKPQGNDLLDNVTDPDYTGSSLLVDYQGTYILLSTMNQTVAWFDADCSGSWTCVDALFLQDLVEATADEVEDLELPVGTLVYDVTGGINGDYEDLAVTHMDFRLFIEPTEICEETPEDGCSAYHEYDANEDGFIDIGEVNTAIDDYRNGLTDLGTVNEVIDLYRTQGSTCLDV